MKKITKEKRGRWVSELHRNIFGMVLGMLMLLCLGTAAYAETNKTDSTQVTIKKVYKLIGKGSSPAETFTLQQVSSSVTDGEAASAPALGTITGASFAAGAATAEGANGNIIIQLPQYEKVGTYEYKLQEVSTNNTAGVTYFANQIRLVVTVINDESMGGKLRIAAVHTESADEGKSDSFENDYSAGTLKISKKVTGDLGDTSKYFKFTVTLTGASGKNYADSFSVSGGSYTSNPTAIKIGEAAVFYLKHDETISIANIPYGVGWTVVEDPADYTQTEHKNDTGTINSAEQTASFVNNKSGTIDTGVILNNMPYLLILLLVLVFAAAVIAKKQISKRR